MTNTSVTLNDTGIADAINDGGPYESARNKMFALDFATQAQEMKAIGGQPDYALGSVHAVTRDGTLVIASASGSQLASYAWGAANVIFVVGAQKLVPTPEAARERIYQHSLKLEDARALCRLRAEQLGREDPGDPPGTARPHPCRPHPTAGRATTGGRFRARRDTTASWELTVRSSRRVRRADRAPGVRRGNRAAADRRAAAGRARPDQAGAIVVTVPELPLNFSAPSAAST